MVKEVVLLFPGQGSQYVGMGKKLSGTPPYVKFTEANLALDYSLSQICFEGPEETLRLTANAQPAIITYSLALFEKLRDEFLVPNNISIKALLGHSVGEYSALVAAEVLEFKEAVLGVHLRGKFMQESVPVGEGKMFAILKATEELVRSACSAVSRVGHEVMPANFNDPTQIVISGHAKACEEAILWMKENSTERFMAKELPVSAPFHSSLMKPAELKLKEAFKDFHFSPNKTPYIANIDSKLYSAGTSGEIIQENLLKQVTGSVLWTQSIQKLPDNTICIEVGPGKILAGLVKKINPSITVISYDSDDADQELKGIL